MSDAVIVSAVRTPIADAYKGALANTSIYDIAKASVIEALKRSGIPAEEVDDLVLGEVLHGGGDIARYLANDAGLPPDTPGLALNRQCATGMSAVDTAAANIRAGMDKVVIAGGAESMTQAPVTFRKPAVAYGVMEQWLSPSHPDSREAPNMNMMITVGENTARKVGVTREEMDEWSYGSHMKALAAIDDGRFGQEIVPMEARGWSGETVTFDTDEHPRRGTSLEKLASLRVLSGVENGTITAGNSSSLNDASAARHRALVVRRRSAARGHRPRTDTGDPSRRRSGRAHARRHRPGRDQRGVRVDDRRHDQGARPGSEHRERQRRGGRPGTSGRVLGRAHHRHDAARVAPSRWWLRCRVALRRRRHGRRHRHRGPETLNRPDTTQPGSLVRQPARVAALVRSHSAERRFWST
jgi:acetyl-CoA acetyltransferase family protein